MTQAPAAGARLPRVRRLSGRIAILFALGSTVALFGISQVVLPRLAASHIRDDLLRNGVGARVSVSAFPALELLFGHADTVDVHVHRMLSGGEGNVHRLLADIGNVGELNASVDRMSLLGFPAEDVMVHKRGAELSASATITRPGIESVIPKSISLNTAEEGGNSLRMTFEARPLGHRIRVAARLIAADGQLRAVPDAAGLEFLHLTAFSDPSLSITGVGVRVRNGRYSFRVSGRYP